MTVNLIVVFSKEDVILIKGGRTTFLKNKTGNSRCVYFYLRFVVCYTLMLDVGFHGFRFLVMCISIISRTATKLDLLITYCMLMHQ